MCGIFAVYNLNGQPVSTHGMAEASRSLRHRGPDDEGFSLIDTSSNKIVELIGEDSVPELRNISSYPDIRNYNNPASNIGFVFRRLSIIDLSPAGHQPMTDNDKNIWLIFNGEIYNYIELREELKGLGYHFKTKTDTEVIVCAYLEWGEECFNKFNGMWGIILYDKVKRKLICSRDRFGVKPLYYFHDESNPSLIIIASEFKAIIKYLRSINYSSQSINPDAVYDYLVYSFVDHNRETFIKNLYHLPASHNLVIDADKKISVKRYYDFKINSEVSFYNKEKFGSYSDEFRSLITDSIRLRLRTDVPVGSCLSGGLDSSSIVSIINKLMVSDYSINREVIGEHQKTFSAVYKEKDCDESEFINEVVRFTNCSANYIYPDAETLASEVEKLIYHLDEPFASTSMYAQWNVMKLAHQNGIKVLLDGQGSDELIGGYEVYYTFFYAQLVKNFRLFSFLKELSLNFPKGTRMIGRGAKFYFKNKKPGTQQKNELVYINKEFLTDNSDRNVLNFRTASNLQERLFEDLTKYSIPNLLRYEDRNSMAFSIEARTPFLDYRLVEFLMNLPVQYKIHNGSTKWILRKSLKDDVPQKILRRKDKKGFPTPEVQWLKALKIEITDTLRKSGSDLDEYIRTANIINDFDNILSNPSIKSNFIWKVYNYAKWKQIYKI